MRYPPIRSAQISHIAVPDCPRSWTGYIGFGVNLNVLFWIIPLGREIFWLSIWRWMKVEATVSRTLGKHEKQLVTAPFPLQHLIAPLCHMLAHHPDFTLSTEDLTVMSRCVVLLWIIWFLGAKNELQLMFLLTLQGGFGWVKGILFV